ncbi:MAG: hypothetical protein Q8L87_15870 [Anaerolineales bacterium]|nr:hypothetical protein [Anaerolineales bacterium]
MMTNFDLLHTPGLAIWRDLAEEGELQNEIEIKRGLSPIFQS